MDHHVFLFLLSVVSYEITCVAEPTGVGTTCPIAEPPIKLGTGVLDKFIDISLKHLFTNQSTVQIDQPIEVSRGIKLTEIHIYGLNSIYRACEIRFTSGDSTECLQRGFLLDTCFGFQPLEANVTLKSWIPGLGSGEFKIKVPHVSANILIELFASDPFASLWNLKATSSIRGYHSFARVALFHITQWSGIELYPLGNSWSQSIVTWLIDKAANLVKGSIVARIDWAVRRALNEQLKEVKLHPLFVDNKPIEWKQKNIAYPTKMPITKPVIIPSRLVAIPVV